MRDDKQDDVLTGAAIPINGLGYGLGKIFNQNDTKVSDVIDNAQYEFFKKGIENANIPIIRSVIINQYGLETAENLNMARSDSYLNTDYAKEHTVFNNYKELNSELREYFKDKITNQLEISKLPIEAQEKILNETKGIFIESTSKTSEDLAHVLTKEPDFIKIINKSKDDLKNNKTVNSSIKFQDKNFHNAIGKADLLDIHKDNMGNIRVLVTDVYNFDKDSKTPLLRAGRTLQDEGKLKPYFIIYDVIIKKQD